MQLSRVACGAAMMAACGGGGSDERFGAPNVEDAIDQTIPVGLGGRRKLAATDDSTPLGAIQRFFVDPVPTLDPDPTVQGSAMGQIKADVRNLDVRMLGADGTSAGSPCLEAAPVTHAIDVSSVSAALKVTLDLQCVHIDDENLPANGMAFGHSGASYSIWSAGVGVNGDVRGLVANITTDAANGAKSYDFLQLENSPSMNRITAYHVIGDIAAAKFEMSYASADPSTRLWCGYRIVADGTHVYAAGKHKSALEGTDCATATEFTLCADATTFAEVAVSQCASLATAFTMPAFTQASVATAGSAINAAVDLTSVSGVVMHE